MLRRNAPEGTKRSCLVEYKSEEILSSFSNKDVRLTEEKQSRHSSYQRAERAGESTCQLVSLTSSPYVLLLRIVDEDVERPDGESARNCE